MARDRLDLRYAGRRAFHQVVRGLTYGIRGIIDGAVVLLFIWTGRRVGVAAGFIQTD